MTDTTKPTFAAEMHSRLKDMETRARAAGSNMTQVCKRADVARATYERWGARVPQSVRKVDDLENKLREIEADYAREQAAAAAAAAEKPAE
jgi:uncharacterized coiled-coil DUF342 family protein